MTRTNGVARDAASWRRLATASGEEAEINELQLPRLMNSYGREALGQLLVQWRLEHQLSVAELADDAGFSIEVVKQIEAGQGLPSARHLLTLAELLELSFEKLLRLVGLVRVDNDDLLHAALKYLVRLSQTAVGTAAAQEESRKFRRLLGRDSRE